MSLSDYRLSVGDVAIWQNCRTDPSQNGKETLVVAGLNVLGYTSLDGLPKYALGYHVQEQDGGLLFAFADQLRRKRPPSREDQQVTTWEKCAWRPKQVRA